MFKPVYMNYVNGGGMEEALSLKFENAQPWQCSGGGGLEFYR